MLNANITNLFIYTLLFIVIVLSGGIVYLLVERRKHYIYTNNIEQQLTLTRINHHFIFNSLSAIQSYIFRNDPLQAGKYLSSFSKLIRLILENSKKDFISIDSESNALNLFLELQSLRYEGKLSFSITVNGNINTSLPVIPPFLIFPIIENSIEHGFIQLSENALINIRFIKNDRSISIEVENTGTDISKSKLNQIYLNQNYQNHSLYIINERIKKIWEINHLRIILEQTDLNNTNTNNFGSIIKFIIPFNA